MSESIVSSRVEQFARALHELWFYERSSAHILAGWIVKIPEFALKLGSARALHQRMNAAHQIDRALEALRNASDLQLQVPCTARDRMITLDAMPSTDAVLERLFLDLGPYLVELHQRALDASDEILNAPLIEVLRASLAQQRDQISWALGALAGSGPLPEWSAAPWRALWSGPTTEPDQVLWRPLDRVTEAARPANVDRGTPGALRPIPFNATTDRAGIALILHNNINGEYTTMELMARCSYEHPDMRAEFHLDMARQASDEARHAAALERLAESYGVRYGDLAVYTYTYDALYQFAACPPGSRQELLWRLLLRATVQEGSSLDDLAFQAKRRALLDQHEMADLFRCLLADEIFHVRSGLKWTRELSNELGKTPIEERARARGHYEAGILVRRHRFVKEHPEQAAREEAERKELLEYRASEGGDAARELVLQVPLRKLAGFSDEDIEQAARWEF
jgi:uncharacterized ferritin-like protein (DUF455 family)